MNVCVIAGGVGAARLLRGAQDVVASNELSAIVNIGDDEVINGLSISPDIDTVMYTCGEAIDADRGWGLGDESWRAMEALRRIASANQAAGSDDADIGWFNLGDRDLGTHMWRSARRAQGASLTRITDELCRAFGVDFMVLPASEDPVPTRVVTVEGDQLSFQEYFVKHQHSVAVTSVEFVGAAKASPAPGVIQAIDSADVVIIAPSNPLVSIAPVRAIPGIETALMAARDRCVAISPILGGKALKGPADRMLTELGLESTATAVARLYADIAGTFVLDTQDAGLLGQVEALGMQAVVTPTIMSNRAAATSLTQRCLDAVLGGAVGSSRS